MKDLYHVAHQGPPVKRTLGYFSTMEAAADFQQAMLRIELNNLSEIIMNARQKPAKMLLLDHLEKHSEQIQRNWINIPEHPLGGVQYIGIEHTVQFETADEALNYKEDDD